MNDESMLAELAQDFIEKIRAGKLPSLEEYASRYPQLGRRIRELFPTLKMLEEAVREREMTQPAIPQAGLASGSIFGAYRIQREIGRGGMGIVYEAVHVSTQKSVALKILPLPATVDPRQLERFYREARITADLNHPNIVPILDVGQMAGAAFYAMPHIEGRGLDRIVRLMQKSPGSDPAMQIEGRVCAGVPAQFDDYLKWAADIGIQAARGLAYAHEHKLIHRDIKPSNLILGDSGTLWIVDFGLARSMEDPALTMTGIVLGTPRYMSPEQAEAARVRVDHRSDIYSLGATLYELLTCRPVFEGETPQEILLAILVREPEPPRRLNPAIPTDLETIVMKAMAKHPDDRYQSAMDLADDLQRWLKMEPIRARRIGPLRRTRGWYARNIKLAAAVCALAVVLIAAGGLYYVRSSRGHTSKESTAEGVNRKGAAANQLANNDYVSAVSPPQTAAGRSISMSNQPAIGTAIKPLEIPLGTIAFPGSSVYSALVELKEKWRIASGGAVDLIINTRDVLFNEMEMVRMMQAGFLAAGMFTNYRLRALDQSVGGLSFLPMTFRTWEEYDYVLGKLSPRLEKLLLDKGFVVLFWGDTGWVRFFSKIPVLHPDDLKRLKVFTWQGSGYDLEADLNVGLMKALGSTPVPMETADILKSLETDRINAIPFPPNQALLLQCYTYAPNMLDLKWMILPGATVIRKDVWDKIPPDIQEKFRSAAATAGAKIRAIERKVDAESIEAMQRKGLVVHPVTPQVEEEWQELTKIIYPELRGKVVPADIFDEVLRLIAEYRARQ
jgi:serine/threonine protein kinase/TRAP-type mannitol/chloroaromatic compound transport system substrate-binding protein